MPSNPSLLALRPRQIAAAALALSCALLPGCIAYDIRDELRTANFRLSSVESQLEELQRTNQRLELVRAQLEILERIQISLANLDDHLSAVRVIITSMNSMMSLFDFSEDDPQSPDDPGAQDPNAPQGAEDEAPNGGAGDAGQQRIRVAPKRPATPEGESPKPEGAPDGR